MEFSLILRRLWRLRLLVAVGVLVAAYVAVGTAYDIDVGDRTLHQRSSSLGAAETIVYVDSTRPALVTGPSDFDQLTARAQVLARLIASGAVRSVAARRLGTQAQDITVEGPLSDAPGQQNVQPPAQERANKILGEGSDYSVFVDTEPNVPTITLFVQADSGAQAVAMGAALVDGLRAYVRRLTRSAQAEELDTVQAAISTLEADKQRSLTAAERRQEARDVLQQGTVIRDVGTPVGGNATDQTGKVMVVLVFGAVLAGWCIVLVLLSGLVAAIRRGD
jgi:hypothetical protein